jgi:hypothetical protein
VRRYDSALAVVARGLSGRDWIAVCGDADDAVLLVRDLLAELGPGYRSFGDARLIETLARRIRGLTPTDPFHWMETATPGHTPDGSGVRWLDAARGRGLGTAVCRFVVDARVREHGRAALMVDAGNAPAVAAYEGIGMTKRLFKAAAPVA